MRERAELYTLAMLGKEHSPANSGRVSEKLNAFEAAVQRELVFKMRRQLAAGLRMSGWASVLCLGGKFEPMGTTHILDAWDPDRNGTMRPAAEALEELRNWPLT